MSFRLKLMITILVLIAMALGIGGTALITASFDASLSEQTSAALSAYEALREKAYLLCVISEGENLEQSLSQLNSRAEQAVSIRWDSTLVYRMGEEMLSGHTLPMPAENQCAYVPVADGYGNGLLVRSGLAVAGETVDIVTRYDLSACYTARDTQLRLFLEIYVVGMVLAIVVAAALSFGLTGRLRRLTGAMRQFSDGDLTVRARIRARDEFGQLSRDFDAMADSLQQSIRRLESEVERQEAFMGAFAHELKTPMTSIIGYADLLRQDKLKEGSALMAADYIFSEGQRLERLSWKLLDLLLLRKEEIALKEVPVRELVEEVGRAVGPVLAQKNIRFSFAGEDGTALLEPDLVRSLLYNLLDNAAKAIDTEGSVTLTGAVLPGGCRFQVEDDGRGMSREEAEKITEAFYRVDKARSRKQGGVGLGLALCKEIVRLHNGKMEFDSAPGQGTRVTVTLYPGGGNENA